VSESPKRLICSYYSFIDKHLARAFDTAKRMYIQQRAVFQELHDSLPADKTCEWSQEAVEAMLVEDKWESPVYETETSSM
jgi:hypothetical protein